MYDLDNDKPDVRTQSFPTGSSEEEIKVIRQAYHEAFAVAAEYNTPHFELGSRMYDLFRGKRPQELDSTFSQLMINIAYAEIRDRVPKLKEGLITKDLFDLRAITPEAEATVDDALAWGRDLMLSPNKLNLSGTIDQTLQSACIFGTGYRMPKVRKNKDGSNYITSEYVDFFQILPMPGGGLVNSFGNDSNTEVPGFFHIYWPSVAELNDLKKRPGANPKEIDELIKKGSSGNFGYNDSESQKRWQIIGGVDYGSSEGLLQRQRDLPNQGDKSRFRVTAWYMRDRLVIMGDDNYVLLNGDNELPGGMLPLTKYCVTPDLDSWHGISTLEMIEDVVLAQLMNFNFRMDYLYRVFFPTKFIRSDIIGDRSEDDFVDSPYSIFPFPEHVKINEAIHIDRMPELNQQAFYEDDRMKALVQQIGGMPNYARGMGGSGSLGNDTATGIVSLIKAAQGSLSAEVEQLESMGLTQEIRIIYLLAQKFITEDQVVRNPDDASGFAWTRINPSSLADLYTVHALGATEAATRDADFQKMLALYPMWNGDNMIDQEAIRKRVVDLSGLWRGYESPVITNQMQDPMQDEMGSAPALGGITSPQDSQNRSRSVNNRNTKDSSGKDKPVGAL